VIDEGLNPGQNTEMAPDVVDMQRDRESDPYEPPSIYIDRVDVPNVYRSLNNN